MEEVKSIAKLLGTKLYSCELYPKYKPYATTSTWATLAGRPMTLSEYQASGFKRESY